MAKKFSAKNYDNLTEQEKQEYKEQITAKAKQRVIRSRIITVCISILSVLALYVAARAAWVRYVCIEIEDNEVTIVRDYALFGGYLNIPDEMFGYPVTSIGGRVFNGRNDIILVNTPNSLTEIGHAAFSGCENIESIDISDSLRVIKGFAFSRTALNQFVIPDSVTEMGKYVFWRCENLESVYIGKTLTAIPESTFDGCISLKEITIPDNITFIGNHAFADCVSLESIVIPDSVTEIEHNVFVCCDNLKEVKLGGGLTHLPYGLFIHSGITEIVIPENIRTIDEEAFIGVEITVKAPHEQTYYGLPNELKGVTWVIEG